MGRVEDQSGKENRLLALVHLQHGPSAAIVSEYEASAYHEPTHLERMPDEESKGDVSAPSSNCKDG